MSATKYWIATVSKDHVKKGQDLQIVQVCHGKSVPLKKINKGDYIIFYSPKLSREGIEPYQKFTAIAKSTDTEIYQVEQFKGFHPFRRKTQFLNCNETSIRPLIDDLEFIQNKKHWGYSFRYGLLNISEKDFNLIANKMNMIDGS